MASGSGGGVVGDMKAGGGGWRWRVADRGRQREDVGRDPQRSEQPSKRLLALLAGG